MDSQIYRAYSDVDQEERSISNSPIINNTSSIVVVVCNQEFIRGCLETWIKKFYREFDACGVSDITMPIAATTLNHAIIVLFHASGAVLVDSWLDKQVAWLRANQPNIPIVAIIEPDTMWPDAETVNRLQLQGYISTSSSMQLAAAVLRLVAAGGTYIPHTSNEVLPSVRAGKILDVPMPARVAGLTQRECGVLELLGIGMSNKIIAYRLGLSHSTVKAHVHNIIVKLNVHNRTEAAVASHQSQPFSIECGKSGVVRKLPTLDYLKHAEIADR